MINTHTHNTDVLNMVATDVVTTIDQWPDPVLDFVNDIRQELINTGNRGLALAANQFWTSDMEIEYLPRIFVLRYGRSILEFINPIISDNGSTKEMKTEACLSYPNKETKKKRWKSVKVQYFTADDPFNSLEREFKGIFARGVQHELDHLNGITLFN